MALAIQIPGHAMRELRESLHLSLRDVERASAIVAEQLETPECVIVPSRLSDIESKGVVPSIHRLCALALIYSVPITTLLSIYGLDVDRQSVALVGKLPLGAGRNGKTSLIQSGSLAHVELPVLERAFPMHATATIKRFIEEWGNVPLAHLRHLANEDHIYVHVGTDDMTMYPLLRPGAFVQVDRKQRRVALSGWSSDYDRPIYLVELRDGYVCCWCDQPRKDQLIVQPHPHAGVAPRVLKYPEECEVMGTVIGIAMRLQSAAW